MRRSTFHRQDNANFCHDPCKLGKSILARHCSDFQALTSAGSVHGDGDLLLDPARVLPQLALRPVRVAVAPAHRLRMEGVNWLNMIPILIIVMIYLG